MRNPNQLKFFQRIEKLNDLSEKELLDMSQDLFYNQITMVADNFKLHKIIKEYDLPYLTIENDKPFIVSEIVHLGKASTFPISYRQKFLTVTDEKDIFLLSMTNHNLSKFIKSKKVS